MTVLKNESTSYPTSVRTKRVATKPGGTNSDKTVVTHRSIVTRYDNKDGVSSPLRTEESGLKWRNPTPYKRYGYETSCQMGTFENVTVGGLTTTTVTSTKLPLSTNVNIPVPRFWDTSYMTDYNAESEVIMKALQKISDGKVDLSVMAAEARKSFDMLAAICIPFQKGLRRLAKRDWIGAAEEFGFNRRVTNRRIDNWHDFVLAYKYGWKPMVMEINSLYEIARENGLKLEAILHGRASIVDSLGVSASGTSPMRYEGRHDCTRRYVAAFSGTLDLIGLKQASTLGLINPLTLAWELVPLSFVFDWFVPIGSFLSVLTGLMGVRFKAGTLTVSHKRSYKLRELPEAPWEEISQRLVVTEGYSMERSIFSSWPLPRLYVKSPLSTGNIVTAVALFSQRRGKAFRASKLASSRTGSLLTQDMSDYFLGS